MNIAEASSDFFRKITKLILIFSTSEEEDDQYDVGENGSEVHNFARTLDSLNHAETHDNPGQGQTPEQVPSHITHVLPGDVIGETQHPVSGKIIINIQSRAMFSKQ